MAPLRVGILTAGVASLSPWELRLFDKICSDARFQLAAVVEGNNDGPGAGNSSPVTDRLFKLDVSRASGIEPFTSAAFRSALAQAEGLHLQRAGDFAHTLRAAIELKVDVWLVHGLDDVAVELGTSAAFGAWWLEVAGQRLQTASAQQALACLDCGPWVRVTLVAAIPGKQASRQLDAASFNLERTPARTLARTAEKSVSLVWRALERLAAERTLPEPPVATAGLAQPSSANDLGRSIKYSAALAHFAGERITRKIGEAAGRHHMRWSLFFGNGAFDAAKLAATHEVRPPKGEFWADPFLFEKDGDTFVFFENYVYATGLGKISAGIYRDGHLHVLGDALDLPYHLSFPLVFEHGGDIYMMPETSAAQRVEIWRAVKFPLQWERFSSALEGVSVADPVLFDDRDKWWLFANISTTPFEDHCNELHVFEVDGPSLGTVTPHACNPVVIGAGTARNAGRIIRRDGKLLRMSQNNAHGIYGYGLNVMEITGLSLDNYSERLVTSIAPAFKPGLIGCHHMDQGASVFVVDACRRLG